MRSLVTTLLLGASLAACAPLPPQPVFSVRVKTSAAAKPAPTPAIQSHTEEVLREKHVAYLSFREIPFSDAIRKAIHVARRHPAIRAEHIRYEIVYVDHLAPTRKMESRITLRVWDVSIYDLLRYISGAGSARLKISKGLVQFYVRKP